MNNSIVNDNGKKNGRLTTNQLTTINIKSDDIKIPSKTWFATFNHVVSTTKNNKLDEISILIS